MIEFRVVRCPRCDVVVMEIAMGLVRGKCPSCKHRVWASSNGHEVRVGMVDAPKVRLAG